MSTHWSPTLWRSAGLPACCSAATAARPAMVVTPVLLDGVLAVPASIRSPPGVARQGRFYVRQSAKPHGAHATPDLRRRTSLISLHADGPETGRPPTADCVRSSRPSPAATCSGLP